jgi:LacI family transcriptional regulator
MSRRPPTLRDVAARAEVHLSTASRALDPQQSGRLTAETVRRVTEAAAALGYAPDLLAAGLKRRRTRTVGVVIADFENPFTGPLSRGVGSVLAEHEHVALFAETEERGDRLEAILKHFLQRRADAIVVTAAHICDGAVLTGAAQDVPIILAIRGVPGTDLPTVLHDDFNGASLAAAHLLDQGHRRFAQLSGPVDIDTFQRRRDGFTARLARDELTAATGGSSASSATPAEGRRLMALVLAEAAAAGEPAPTAVFAPSDVMAVGAIEALADAGLDCPGDVSIVGYNDIPLVGHLSPPLTTVRLPSEELGRTAGRLALQVIADPGLETEILRLPAVLIERSSTRPPAG